MRNAVALVEGAPQKLEEIEGRFRERNAEYVAVKQRYDALDEDQRTRSSDLALLEESRQKFQADLMQVQNQREYSAMLKEIDSVKSQIAEHEEAIITDLEEIETVKGQLATHEEHINAERVRVTEECAEVEQTADRARETIVQFQHERSAIESELPGSLISSVRRLEEGRQGQFLSRADDGVCQSCYVRVRPQGFQEVKLALAIHYCSNCKRLLYHEPSVQRMAAEAQGATDSGRASADSDPIEAIDGGAV